MTTPTKDRVTTKSPPILETYNITEPMTKVKMTRATRNPLKKMSREATQPRDQDDRLGRLRD
jgi:hypothetical protein